MIETGRQRSCSYVNYFCMYAMQLHIMVICEKDMFLLRFNSFGIPEVIYFRAFLKFCFLVANIQVPKYAYIGACDCWRDPLCTFSQTLDATASWKNSQMNVGLRKEVLLDDTHCQPTVSRIRPNNNVIHKHLENKHHM